MIGDIFMSIEVNGITHSISISGEHGNEWTTVSPSDLDMARSYIDNIIELDNNRERSAISVPGNVESFEQLIDDGSVERLRTEAHWYDDRNVGEDEQGEGWATIEQLVDPDDEPTGQVEQVGFAKSQYDTTEDIEVDERSERNKDGW